MINGENPLEGLSTDIPFARAYDSLAYSNSNSIKPPSSGKKDLGISNLQLPCSSTTVSPTEILPDVKYPLTN